LNSTRNNRAKIIMMSSIIKPRNHNLFRISWQIKFYILFGIVILQEQICLTSCAENSTKLNIQSHIVAPQRVPNVYKIPAKPGNNNSTGAPKVVNTFQLLHLNLSVPQKNSSAGKGSETKRSCLFSLNFSKADTHAKKFPRQNVKSIEALAHDLTKPFENCSLSKARAIFTWFHYNIAYDTVAFFAGKLKPKSVEETLRSGISVCQGYADLFAKLAEIAGLDVKVITGHAKGVGYIPIERTGGKIPPFSSNHAWNAVKLNNQWQLIDPSWGAGVTNEQRQYVPRFEPKFFCLSPEEFRIRHFPTNPEDQYTSPTITWNEYISIKEGPLIYVGFADKGFNEYTLEPKVRTIKVEKQPVKFVVRSPCPDLEIYPEDRVVLVLTSGGKVVVPFKMEVPGKVWSVTLDEATLKKNVIGGKIQLDFIDRLGKQSGNGLTLEKFEKEKSRLGYGLTGLALWDVKF